MLDVVHSIAAVGSRSVESAQKFIQDYAKGDSNIKAYGTYNEVFADPVSMIYGSRVHNSDLRLHIERGCDLYWFVW